MSVIILFAGMNQVQQLVQLLHCAIGWGMRMLLRYASTVLFVPIPYLLLEFSTSTPFPVKCSVGFFVKTGFVEYLVGLWFKVWGLMCYIF